MIRRGQVWWVDFGEPRESEPGFRHPALVLQREFVFLVRIDALINQRLADLLDEAGVEVVAKAAHVGDHAPSRMRFIQAIVGQREIAVNPYIVLAVALGFALGLFQIGSSGY